MSTEKHRAEYLKRVNRVVDHIEAHRAEELTLEALAAVAGFSPFHFHRVFKAMTGENLMEHIQRIRLEAAASALVQKPHLDILAIALDLGFGSASAFARAFKERFGMTASDWRKGGQADRKLGQAIGNAGKASGEGESQALDMDPMNVTVENLPAYRLAYLRTVGPYGPGDHIPKTWERLARWAAARDLWTPDRVCLGISHDSPRVTDPSQCRYDAAIAIPADFKVDGDVNVTEVSGGKYAILPFRGGAEAIGPAYDALFSRWLPRSGYQPDDRAIFERYGGEAFDEKACQVVCDICVAVRPL